MRAAVTLPIKGEIEMNRDLANIRGGVSIERNLPADTRLWLTG
jgi:hypothetical protein